MDIIVILDACMSSIMGFDDLMQHILVQFNPHIIHAEKVENLVKFSVYFMSKCLPLHLHTGLLFFNNAVIK